MLDIANSSRTAAVGEDTRKSWEMMIVDALIIAAIALFGNLPDLMPTMETAWIAIRAFGLAFFIQMAIERGIKRE